ncbi:MAG: prepilin-type N-terminal cleavage/methylation domain-containing protein [Leptolyngbya sp. SIO1E4]|nr:prepilin-type N-terminal cleavage/methylation domain-containing protein [Leptolyngbya sp. SIO1E4]
MKTSLKAKLLQHFLNKKKEGGFTLIELLVVIIIIGILAAIALPAFLNQAVRARETEAQTNLGAINRAQQAYLVEFGEFAGPDTEVTIDEEDLTGLAVLDVDIGADEDGTAVKQYYVFTLLAPADGIASATAAPDPDGSDADGFVGDRVAAAMLGCVNTDGDTGIFKSARGNGEEASEPSDDCAAANVEGTGD